MKAVVAPLRNLAMKFQSLVIRRARRKILKFTDSRFLNLAWAQVNFKIYLARVRPPYYRAAAQIKIKCACVPLSDKINDRSRAAQA